MVTVPLSAMVKKALMSNHSFGGAFAASTGSQPQVKPITKPPPAHAEVFRKERLSTFVLIKVIFFRFMVYDLAAVATAALILLYVPHLHKLPCVASAIS